LLSHQRRRRWQTFATGPLVETAGKLKPSPGGSGERIIGLAGKRVDVGQARVAKRCKPAQKQAQPFALEDVAPIARLVSQRQRTVAAVLPGPIAHARGALRMRPRSLDGAPEPRTSEAVAKRTHAEVAKSARMKNTLLACILTIVPAWAQPAAVRIEARPADALIFVDRQIRGKGVAEISDLQPGQHLLRVSAGEDWETDLRVLQVESGKPVNLTIELKPGGAKLLRQGRQALEAGDYSTAIANFRKAAAARPVAAAWWEGVAQQYKGGSQSAAIAAFRRYAQFQPSVPQLHWLLAQLHESQGEHAQAFTAYKTAALSQPRLASALQNLPKPTDAAIKKLESSTAPADQLRVAQLLMLKGRMKEANVAAKRALGEQARLWSVQDWTDWEPPLPAPPTIEVAPPEDQLP
jgi:hypothetical protein